MRRNFIIIWSALLLLLFGVVAGRLAWLMLAQGQALAARAEQQQTRSLEYYQYARGDIVDRSDRALVNIAENCAVAFPAMIGDIQAVAEEAAALLGDPKQQIAARLQAGKNSLSPYILKTGLSSEQARSLISADIDGLKCLTLAARYSSSGAAGHVIGFVGEAESGLCGLSGLESRYEEHLKARDDKRLLAYVDATGGLSAADMYMLEAPSPRYNELRLTIDLDYQQIAERAFAEAGYRGACVIMDADNGDVLAMVSSPGFDPYGWEMAEDGAYINKALAFYPPASTFKTVLAAAALIYGVELPQSPLKEPEEPFIEAVEEAEVMDGADIETEDMEAEPQYGPFICQGAYTVNDSHSVHCLAASAGHGEVDLSSALAKSCNCYFVALGQILGGDAIRETAALLGLDEQIMTGYELDAADAAGRISFNGNSAAELANASLGELGIRVSALQEARLMAALCNGGNLPLPRLVQGVYDQDGRALLEYPPAEAEPVLDSQIAEELRQMLVEAVLTGTGKNAAGEFYDAGGKTGTGEAGGVWFSGFAPARHPRWSMAVYVEDGIAGGTEAAAVFKRIIDDIAKLEGDALIR